MRRIYEANAYGDAPIAESFWPTTVTRADRPSLNGDETCEIAIVGAGFTGLSAALHLGRDHGRRSVVVDARHVGWGASGRNGGFCCVGGSKLSMGKIKKRYGAEEALAFVEAQKAAVNLVADILDHYEIDVDRHSDGETLLAHLPNRMAGMREDAEILRDHCGIPTTLHEKGALRELGLDSPEFYGGMTSHIGFALNPAKYVHGLARAAESHGAKILENTPVTHTGEENGKHVLHTPNGRIIADKVIFATNGYSSEDVPKWLAHRYLPALSSIIVTRPMSGQELAAQGWTSHQMCADTRRLLHYFHLMPDGRMLFGMRGGTSAKGASERRIRQIIRGNFDRFFPAWRDVETPHFWSGFVCLTRPLVPFSGAIPGMPGAFAGYGYHGSGVSMGSYNGMLLASLAAGTKPAGPKPAFMEKAPGIFPPGRLRRGILPVTYAVLKQMDAF